MELKTNRDRVKKILGVFTKYPIRKLYIIIKKYKLYYIIATNSVSDKLSEGLSVQLSDGKALDGYNFPFCVLNFLWAFIMFVLGCLSFVFDFSKNKDLNAGCDKGCFEDMDLTN